MKIYIMAYLPDCIWRILDFLQVIWVKFCFIEKIL